MPPAHESRASGPGAGIQASLRERLTLLREQAREGRHRRRRRSADDFHWYEREWQSRFWVTRLGLTPRTLVTIALIASISAVVLAVAAHAASQAAFPVNSNGTTTNANPIIIQQVNGSSAPTSAPPTYTVGLWVSNMSPPASGSLQVYVRVTKNTIQNGPVANAAVQVSSTNGVVRSERTPGSRTTVATTDANGLADFTLYYGAAPGTPIYLVATATIGGHAFNANTVFVAG